MPISENAVYGYDTVRIQNGYELPLYSRAAAFTAGTVTSAVASFYNTGVSVANVFGADAEQMNTQNVLSQMDSNWGGYYAENKDLIDTAGFIAGAFVPGAIGMKAMQFAKAGKYAGAAGNAVGGVLNTFARKSSERLALGLTEIASEGGTAYAFVNGNKMAALAWNTADKVLEVAAGELLIAASMKQSPILADNSWGQIGKDIAINAVVGGGIMGGLGAFQMNKLFKDTVKQVDAVQRKYDAVDTFKALDLYVGDKVYGLVDSLLGLPDEALAADKLLKIKNPLLGNKEVTLDLTSQLTKSISSRNKGAEIKLRELFMDSKSVDTETGIAMGEFIVNTIKQGKKAGAGADEIKQVLGDYVLGLKGVHGLHEDMGKAFARSDVFYVRTEAFTPAEIAAGDVATKAFSRIPQSGAFIKQPYIITGEAKDITSALIGPERAMKNIQDAWDAGFDTAILADNTMRINPKSQIIKHLSDDPAFKGTRFLNTRTGQVTEDAIVTAADTSPNIQKYIDKRGVDKFNFSLDTWYDDISELTVKEATSRHAWVAKMGDELFKRKDAVINSTDISAMSFLGQAKDPKALAHVMIDFGDGDLRKFGDLGDEFKSLFETIKMDEATKLFANGPVDPREVAYKLNMTEEALSNLVGSDFRTFRGAGANTLDEAASFDRPLGQYLRKENVMVNYDVADALPSFAEGVDVAELTALQKAKELKPDFIDGEIGWQGRVSEATDRLITAFKSVVPADLADQFQDIDYQQLVKLANQTGAGATTFGASNADYADASKLFYQNTGKLTHRLRERWVEEAVGRMKPHLGKIQADPVAAAELGTIDFVMRGADEPWRLWDHQLPNGEIRKMLVPMRAVDVDAQGVETISKKILEEMKAAGKKPTYTIENKAVADFAEEWVALNGERVERRMQLLTARGFTSTVNPKAFYAPPIDTTKLQHFVFVREVEGALGSSGEVTMVVARDAKQLQQKIAQIPTDRFETFTKQATEDYLHVKGVYEQARALNSPRIDSELRKAGVLTDFMPTTRADSVIADYMSFANSSWSSLARESVETRYGQLFEQLRFLGKNYTETASSVLSGNLANAKQTAVDPFRDGIRTALDISKSSQHKLLAEANEFVDALGTRAYRAIYDATGAADKGRISWQEAEKIGKKYGIGGVYNHANVEEAYRLTNIPYDRNLLRETVSKVNTVLTNTVLRLDFINPIINSISATITSSMELASLKTLAKDNPQLASVLDEFTSVTIPGSGGKKVFSSTKLQAKALAAYWSPEGVAKRAEYYLTGDLKNPTSMFHSMMNDLALPSVMDNRAIDRLSESAQKYVELGAKYTGNNFAEELTRFTSAYTMDMLTEPAVKAGLLSKQEAAAWRSVFVNRTQGNYITSQRPIVFQGTSGAAIGLFQTYAFNLLQQLGRHIENKDARALITFGGMQSALFGFNGMPFFEAANTHLIGNAAVNDSHSDIYSTVTKAAGKEMGDWLMYGTASAFPFFTDKMPALYTRGDVNPRHLTILPVSPASYPFIDASIRVATNMVDVAGRLAGGGAVVNTVLEGLEHNGISRPLAGLAQAAQGYSSTSKGSLIAANADMWSIANVGRILGAKPVDESVAMNAAFRLKAYQAKDAARMEFLGETVKTHLKNNQMPDDETMNNFLASYASIGGRVENYSKAIQRWQRDSNIGLVNQMMFFHDTPQAQRMLTIMEGKGLEDFSFNPAQQPQQQQQFDGGGMQQPQEAPSPFQP